MATEQNINFPRLLSIQDISCVGKCSLTVALPIISACGIETAILPSSVLSNHTGGFFKSWTFHDLTEEMLNILEVWKKENVSFDAFYTGYVTKAQISNILRIMAETARPGALRIVDPVLGDNGRLYSGFDDDFPVEMRRLCDGADVILPNLTEAAFLLGRPYLAEGYGEPFVEDLLKSLHALGARNVVLTGVAFDADHLGVACYDGQHVQYYFTERLGTYVHGTGDCFASAFSGALLRGKSVLESATIAADFVVETIRQTADSMPYAYGTHFERALPLLFERLN